jgi:hypothetical protein
MPDAARAAQTSAFTWRKEKTMLIEFLETRRLLSASLAPNPGDPQAAQSGNEVGIASSSLTHNGTAVSDQAQAGTRSDNVQALLAASGLGSDA